MWNMRVLWLQWSAGVSQVCHLSSVLLRCCSHSCCSPPSRSLCYTSCDNILQILLFFPSVLKPCMGSDLPLSLSSLPLSLSSLSLPSLFPLSLSLLPLSLSVALCVCLFLFLTSAPPFCSTLSLSLSLSLSIQFNSSALLAWQLLQCIARA